MFFKKKKEDEEEVDWRDISALPREVVSKKELDTLQDEVVNELDKLQRETIAEVGSNSAAKPQALFYCHKYIDSKFNKKDFDIDTYFVKKQNIIDQKYAEGVGDLKAELTGYKELIDRIKEIDKRLRKKINKLDPTSCVDENSIPSYDDSDYLIGLVDDISEGVDWKGLEGE